ncbi:hypothetical protein JCM6882_006919 [Rhodosporidiobolus microsporus]
MTTLDPTHIPGLHLSDDRTTGQAVRTSVPASAPAPAQTTSEKGGQEGEGQGEGEEGEGEVSALRSLSERLAEADRRRREERGAAQAPGARGPAKRSHRQRGDDSDDEDGDGEEDEDRVPIPPIPDLRYEQGVLASIRPFIHRVAAPSSSSSPFSSSAPSAASTSGEKPKPALEKTVETTALATTSLTAEGPGKGGEEGEVNVFDLGGEVRVEWGRVAWVLGRDQIIFPLLQGILWALGGYYLSAFWSWNRARLDASSRGLPRPSLLRSVGIRSGY